MRNIWDIFGKLSLFLLLGANLQAQSACWVIKTSRTDYFEEVDQQMIASQVTEMAKKVQKEQKTSIAIAVQANSVPVR